MKVAVIGATGVIGTSAVRALVASGHDVVGLARTPDKAAVLDELGAESSSASLFDRDGLIEMLSGCDAVCNFATHVPVGYGAVWPGSWRQHDMLRTDGVRLVLDAARAAGVRRVVQESASFIYAGNGDGWITEASPLGINLATEPVSVGESHMQQYQCGSRHGVVLRFGAIVGDEAMTRRLLSSVQRGLPMVVGTRGSWAHVVHADDLGGAVTAALDAPSGVYNVGAEPVLWDDYVQGTAVAVGKASCVFTGPLLRRLAGLRAEPLSRSLRVSSEHFTSQTGWTPRRPAFDSSWFELDGAKAQALQ